MDELQQNELLDDLEKKSVTHDIYILPNFFSFAVKDNNIPKDLIKASENFSHIVEKANEAKSNGYYIEYICLLSSYIEYHLRMYIC
jgi:hypothetical protein